MTDCCSASSTDLMLFEKYGAELSDWMKLNPGTLFKVGGKSKSSNRHQNATHYPPGYDRKYFDTGSSYIFFWRPRRQQASRMARAQVDSVYLLQGIGRQ